MAVAYLRPEIGIYFRLFVRELSDFRNMLLGFFGSATTIISDGLASVTLGCSFADLMRHVQKGGVGWSRFRFASCIQLLQLP